MTIEENSVLKIETLGVIEVYFILFSYCILDGGKGWGGANGKEGSNVRKCVICEVLLDFFSLNVFQL